MAFKERLAAGELLRGVGHVLPTAVATQALAAAGLDFVMIDREHGPIDRGQMHAMIAATGGTACAPLVRVPSVDEAEVKSALDAGAEGIVYPLVRTVADAERCVAYMTYPPAGTRGWGPFVAHSRWGTTMQDYAADVGEHLACCLLLETVESVENAAGILAVPGVDLAVVAQFDLSVALGAPGDFASPSFLDAVEAIERAATAADVPLGRAALTREQSLDLQARGYRVLFHEFDVMMLRTAVAEFRTW